MEIPTSAQLNNTQAQHLDKHSESSPLGRHDTFQSASVTPHASAGSSKPGTSTQKGREKKRDTVAKTDDVPSTSGVIDPPPKPLGGNGKRRGARFNAGLTDPGSTPLPPPTETSSKPVNKYRNKSQPPKELATDLASTLVRALRTPPYPDCPICFSSIQPSQRIWSCSPSIPISRPPEATGEEVQYCWTIFHVKCIDQWATRSMKQVSEAWRARGEPDRKGDWRCPGCQAKRETVPSGYWCFCGSTAEPKPPRLATPHSCANPCSRVRENGCGHACPLACHPGPCPPCQVTTRLECYCPRKKPISFRCGIDQHGKATSAKGRDLSCGDICGRKLACSKHSCERVCHDGPCEDCKVREVVKCHCGDSEMEVGCGEGEMIKCVDSDRGEWFGQFRCFRTCQRYHDCLIHKCEQPCHPPHEPAICPLSPKAVTHCPCGRHLIPSSSSARPSTGSNNFQSRESCTSPIPTCTSPCGKPQVDCSHPCAATCHTNSCPPCSVPLVKPCRCGTTSKQLRCCDFTGQGSNEFQPPEILCDKPCMTLRSCGRHECGRICCPLAALAGVKKGKKRRLGSGMNLEDLDPAPGEEPGGLHECELICQRPLGCGLHRCEEKDHRGACPRCLQSSFEELYCHCGRTVLEPPVPCGTRIKCSYPCLLPPPCGHPAIPHLCHEDPNSPCPPCPSLTIKECACGKKMVKNVRCSLEKEKVSCGTVCSRLMACGFHHCERPCHASSCGSCAITCGKLRKNCLPLHHPCPLPCHAPSTCAEDVPCESLVTQACPCGRIKQSVPCGRSAANPSGPQHLTIKCNNDCATAKRNARLADALGITAESREKFGNVAWSDELVGAARANSKLLAVVEKVFEEFIKSGKKTHVMSPTQVEKRKFVHDVAVAYKMDTQMVDQEPNRSVRLLRRPDTRIPTPLLSSMVAPFGHSQPNLGKLADLRSSTGSPSSLSWRPSTPLRPNSAGNQGVPGSERGPASWVPAPKQPASTATLKTSVATAPASRVSTPQPAFPSVVPDSWEDD